MVEGARLECVYAGNRIGGSNPSPSATSCNCGMETCSPRLGAGRLKVRQILTSRVHELPYDLGLGDTGGRGCRVRQAVPIAVDQPRSRARYRRSFPARLCPLSRRVRDEAGTVSLHSELLKQARFLARKEPKQPTQDSLRGSVSASWYALFHPLVDESNRLILSGRGRGPLRNGLGREPFIIPRRSRRSSPSPGSGSLRSYRPASTAARCPSR